MKRVVVVLALVMAGASVGLVAACSGGDRPTRTQNSRVNAVIETMEAQDGERLRELLQLVRLPCTEEAGSATQPLCQGEPAGTEVQVFQANECEPGWLREAAIDPVLDEVMAFRPSVYAAFETPEAFYLSGRYAVVFEGDETRADEPELKRYFAVGVEADSGLITGIALGCGIGEPAHFLLPHQNEEFEGWLLEPP